MQIRDRIKGLRRVKASELRPNPRNWRTHPKAQREALRGILAEIGYADALLARETPEGLQLIDGHLRAETTPDQEVPVLVLDLDEKEAEKLLVSLDPLAAMAGRNDDLLRDLLSGIETESAALRDMWAGLAVPLPGEGLTDPDAIPEPPEEPVTRAGDLWALGDHRLLCGDSAKPEDVDRLLGGAPVHLVNTDPPYNVKVEPRSNNAIAAGLSSFTQTHHQGLDVARHPEKAKPTGRMRAKDRPLVNDFVPEEEFGRMVGAWFGNVARVLLPGRGFFIWGGYSNLLNFPRAIVDAGLKASSVDSGMPRVADDRVVEYVKASDEHGVLRLNGAAGYGVGDKLRLIPGHCDPTVNLYDHYVCVRDGRVEALWPITARGAVW